MRLVLFTALAAAMAVAGSAQVTEKQSMELSSVEGLTLIPTQRSVADILARTTSIAQARGITVFATIDFSGDAARSNLALKPAGLVILGNPVAGTPVMVAAPSTAIDLPLKILAFEDASGRHWVAYNEPAYLQRRHGFPEELLKNLAPIGALARLVAGDE
jgi:uncharacterized protein (DUF302 family)